LLPFAGSIVLAPDSSNRGVSVQVTSRSAELTTKPEPSEGALVWLKSWKL